MDAEGLRAAEEFRADLLARAEELRTAAAQQVAIARELRSLTVETRTRMAEQRELRNKRDGNGADG